MSNSTHAACCWLLPNAVFFFFFFLRGLLFLFLFLAVDQQTQLIECDLGGFSSSALSHPLARPPQSVVVIKRAHSSSKKGQAPRPHFITGESLKQDAEPHAFPWDVGLSLTLWPLCEEWEVMNNFFSPLLARTSSLQFNNGDFDTKENKHWAAWQCATVLSSNLWSLGSCGCDATS